METGGPLPRISVVVPSFNQGHFLRDTLESILRQNYPDLEVVVMDGGSTDGSVDIIREYAPRLKHWQSGKDGGQSAAINAGIRHCSGQLVAWLNSDDFYWRDALWTVGRAFAAYPGRGLYIGNGLRYDQRTGRRLPFLLRHVCLNRTALREGPDYILQPSTFFLREAWEAVGGLDPQLRFCMDWDIFLRIGQRYPAVTINEFLGVSREYEDTKTSTGRMGRANEIARMIQSHTGKELTAGTLCYLLDTFRNLFREDPQGTSPRLIEHLSRSLGTALDSFSDGYGDGYWSPVHPEPQDACYVPVPRASAAQPPRPDDAPALPAVSVILPTHNQREALAQTLASVLHQEYADLEVLVVDAGSTDGTVEMIAGQWRSVRLLQCAADVGLVRRINEGLAAARGEVLTWLQPGDLLTEGALRAAGEAFAEDPRRDLLHGNAMFIDPQGGLCVADIRPYRSAFWYGDFAPPDDPPGYGRAAYAVPLPTVCCRRRLLEKCGALDESYPHIFDYEWVVRCARHAVPYKLERTQALMQVGAREDGDSWPEKVAELYRYSRARWPWLLSWRFPAALGRFVASVRERKFGTHARGLGVRFAGVWIALAALTRLGNPERWWLRRSSLPRLGAAPLHLPLPVARLRPAVPLVFEREALPQDGAAYYSVACLSHVPAQPGGPARQHAILRALKQVSALEVLTCYSVPAAERAALPADVLYTPDTPARHGLDRIWQGVPRDRWYNRLLNALRGWGLPVLGPTNPLHVTQQIRQVRAYCAPAIQERLSCRGRRPDFLFVGDQTNPLTLTLALGQTDTRLVLIASAVEAEAARRAIRGWGPGRLALALEASRARRFEGRNLACFDGVIAASEEDKRSLGELYGMAAERIHVVGPVADVEAGNVSPHGLAGLADWLARMAQLPRRHGGMPAGPAGKAEETPAQAAA
jgi:glycosyltransferase involved in cell wall biosynthesis